MISTSIANAVAAYANAAKSPGLGATASGGNFGDHLQQAVKSAVDSIQQGEDVSIKATTGKADITEVVSAMSNAQMTLQTVTAVRDRVISAYQEILRMPI
jgi:flagellar hook-basal body complex protein FliE